MQPVFFDDGSECVPMKIDFFAHIAYDHNALFHVGTPSDDSLFNRCCAKDVHPFKVLSHITPNHIPHSHSSLPHWKGYDGSQTTNNSLRYETSTISGRNTPTFTSNKELSTTNCALVVLEPSIHISVAELCKCLADVIPGNSQRYTNAGTRPERIWGWVEEFLEPGRIYIHIHFCV